MVIILVFINIYIYGGKKMIFFGGGVLDFKSHKGFQKYYHVLYDMGRMPHITMHVFIIESESQISKEFF